MSTSVSTPLWAKQTVSAVQSALMEFPGGGHCSHRALGTPELTVGVLGQAHPSSSVMTEIEPTSMRSAKEMMLPIELTTVCITSLLYGIFLLLFGSFVYISTTCLPPTINGLCRDPFYVSLTFIVGMVLLMLISANWVLTIVHLFDGLMDDTGELQLRLFFYDLVNPTYVAKSVLYFMTALSQDTIIEMTNCPTAAGANGAYQLSRHTEGDRIVNRSAGHWIVSAAVLTFVTYSMEGMEHQEEDVLVHGQQNFALARFDAFCDFIFADPARLSYIRSTKLPKAEDPHLSHRRLPAAVKMWAKSLARLLSGVPALRSLSVYSLDTMIVEHSDLALALRNSSALQHVELVQSPTWSLRHIPNNLRTLRLVGIDERRENLYSLLSATSSLPHLHTLELRSVILSNVHETRFLLMLPGYPQQSQWTHLKMMYTDVSFGARCSHVVGPICHLILSTTQFWYQRIATMIAEYIMTNDQHEDPLNLSHRAVEELMTSALRTFLPLQLERLELRYKGGYRVDRSDIPEEYLRTILKAAESLPTLAYLGVRQRASNSQKASGEDVNGPYMQTWWTFEEQDGRREACLVPMEEWKLLIDEWGSA
ncbi:uncharacterized protein LAESUDRAFT_716545 [Laetiporus sulphureus 93-53]|uniref:Uncharacterized protein n=1 Tax=Laetiporus sulphureus 93-53 TaxID=1314785 RepID=A0A165CKD4_9APHY|nr:uncharacterized protein LAESUDRAFT_716545 [Laetiporus sulphureus 93-53]KZT02971.1 hypothetical protein LAESUDRAFT_716545 [Laetiporus sulphureus 93-53]